MDNDSNEIPCPDATNSSDPELEFLLDSALDDFDKKPQINSSQQNGEEVSLNQNESENAKNDKDNSEDLLKDVFNEAFGDNPSDFQDLLKSAIGESSKLASDFADQLDESSEVGYEFTETFKKTLNSLSQNTENLENEFNQDDFLKTFEGLVLDGLGSDESDGAFVSSMQNMMKLVLSKETLYPCMKDISTQYPSWLSENKDKISESEFQRYQKQFACMSQICNEFESENASDPEEVKNKRFDKILEITNEMQNYGQPPDDLVGNMNDMPGLPGFPKFDNMVPPNGGEEECCIM